MGSFFTIAPTILSSTLGSAIYLSTVSNVCLLLPSSLPILRPKNQDDPFEIWSPIPPKCPSKRLPTMVVDTWPPLADGGLLPALLHESDSSSIPRRRASWTENRICR